MPPAPIDCENVVANDAGGQGSGFSDLSTMWCSVIGAPLALHIQAFRRFDTHYLRHFGRPNGQVPRIEWRIQLCRDRKKIDDAYPLDSEHLVYRRT